MWWLENARPVRLLAALTLAGLAAGCFQPLYGDLTPTVAGAGLDNRLAAVEVSQIAAPNGSRIARVANEVRDDLLFRLTGGGHALPPTHRLDISLSSTQLQVIVDVNSARPEVQNYGINANYTLIDLATNRPVVTGQTFSRVSYNIPGQQQRFAGQRGQRDAENRAAKVIADNIHSRLASYFVAGT
jgi:LPS-assembly lipoprotein